MIQKKYEGLAHSSREQVEAANGIASNATVGSRGNSNAAHQLSFVNNSLVAYSEEFDTSIVKFNTVRYLNDHHFLLAYACVVLSERRLKDCLQLDSLK